jgi:hypothetical protein
MEFRFDANQKFQIEAIEAVAGLLEGQACLSAHVRDVVKSRALG